MADPDKLTGDRRLEELLRLQQERVLINLQIEDRDFERLTLVLDVRVQADGTTWFCLDPPRGMAEEIENPDTLTCNCSYNGEDKLEYRFTAKGASIEAAGIWMPLPDAIFRIQRRRHFRIEVPVETQIQFELNGHRLHMDVVNISVSGALVLFVIKKSVFGSEYRLNTELSLKNVRLILPVGDDRTGIPIEEAIVRRLETDPNTGRPRYGIEFLSFDSAIEHELTRRIYALQRQYLQKR